MKPIEEKKLVVQAEGLSGEQAALFEQKQVIEETVDNLFNTFVLEKNRASGAHRGTIRRFDSQSNG